MGTETCASPGPAVAAEPEPVPDVATPEPKTAPKMAVLKTRKFRNGDLYEIGTSLELIALTRTLITVRDNDGNPRVLPIGEVDPA